MISSHLSEADLIDYADGELSGVRLLGTREHLKGCRACTEALQAMQTAADAVRVVQVPPAPSDLRRRITTRIAAEPVPGISCREARRLVHQSLDAKPAPLTEGMLRLHLAGCATCRQESVTLAAAVGVVRRLPPVPAPGWVRQAAYASAHAHRLSTPWSVRLRPALAAAAMAAGALVLLVHQDGRSPVQNVVRRPLAGHVVTAEPPKPVLPPPPMQAQAPVEPAAPPVPSEIATAETRERPPVLVARRRVPSVSPVNAVPSDTRLRRPRPLLQLAVHAPVPAPAPAPAEETPSAIQTLHAVARAAAGESPRARMMEVADRWAVWAAEDQSFPKAPASPRGAQGSAVIPQPARGSDPSGPAAAGKKAAARPEPGQAV